MASNASVASLVITVETGLSDEEGPVEPSHLGEKSWLSLDWRRVNSVGQSGPGPGLAGHSAYTGVLKWGLEPEKTRLSFGDALVSLMTLNCCPHFRVSTNFESTKNWQRVFRSQTHAEHCPGARGQWAGKYDWPLRSSYCDCRFLSIKPWWDTGSFHGSARDSWRSPLPLGLSGSSTFWGQVGGFQSGNR